MSRRARLPQAEYEEQVLAKRDRPVRPRRRPGSTYTTCQRCGGPARVVDIQFLENLCPPCWTEADGPADASHERFPHLMEQFYVDCQLARARYHRDVRTEMEQADDDDPD